MKKIRLSLLMLFSMMVLVLLSCGQAVVSPEHLTGRNEFVQPIQLTISAAASLQDALKDVEALYQQSSPHVAITYNLGASGALAQQIIQGAPVDVFLSASPDWMDRLERQEQLKGARVDLLQNSLVLVVPANPVVAETFMVNSFQDLRSVQVKRVAMGEPQSVPAGHYGEEVLEAMGLLEALQQRLVFGKSVRQVLAYVETGAVDAGLVYLTDAEASNRVRIVAEASKENHSPILYSVGATTASDQAALDFVEFLTSDAAMAIFQQHGFARIR